jgi:hypothetical protein
MLEADLFTKLSTLVSGRVYPDVASSATMPYITYQQIGGTPVNFLGAESSSKKNARIQINVWSATRLQASTIIRQVEDLMVQTPLFGTVESGAESTYEEATKKYGSRQDFSFWS